MRRRQIIRERTEAQDAARTDPVDRDAGRREAAFQAITGAGERGVCPKCGVTIGRGVYGHSRGCRG